MTILSDSEDELVLEEGTGPAALFLPNGRLRHHLPSADSTCNEAQAAGLARMMVPEADCLLGSEVGSEEDEEEELLLRLERKYGLAPQRLQP